MKIRDIVELVKERGVPTVSEECAIEVVIDVMYKFPHSRLVYVVNEKNELAGTISLGLFVRHALSHKYEPSIHPRRLLEMVTHKTAVDIMLKAPVTATEDEDVELVLKRMVDANIKEIGVLDMEGRLVADVTMLDLLKTLGGLPEDS